MNRAHPRDQTQHIASRDQQLRDMEKDLDDRVPIEGIHQSVIITDTFGNEWDDTGDFGEIDFRTVDDL